MHKLILPALPLVLLSGCLGESEPEGPIQSGRWQITKEVVTTDFEERGEADTEALASEMNAQTICMAPEEVAPMPTAKIFAGNSAIKCDYSNVSFADGNMSADVSCDWPDSGEAVGTVTGTYTTETFQGEWTVEQTVDGESKKTTGAISGKATAPTC